MSHCFKRKKGCHGKGVVGQKSTQVIPELALVAKDPKIVLWSQQMARGEKRRGAWGEAGWGAVIAQQALHMRDTVPCYMLQSHSHVTVNSHVRRA